MSREVVSFYRGSKSTMPTAMSAGRLLIATDTGEAYVDDSSTTRVQLKDSTKLPLSGGTLTGPLDLGSNQLTTSYVPTEDDDVVNKAYLDEQLSDVGGTPVVYLADPVSLASSTIALSLTIDDFPSTLSDNFIVLFQLYCSAGTTGVITNAAISTLEINSTSVSNVTAAYVTYVTGGYMLNALHITVASSSMTRASSIFGGDVKSISGDDSIDVSIGTNGAAEITHTDYMTTGTVGTNYGPTGNSTLAAGGSFKVPQIVPGTDGHIQAIYTRTLTLPSDSGSSSDVSYQLEVYEGTVSGTNVSVSLDFDTPESYFYILVLLSASFSGSSMTMSITTETATYSDVVVSLGNDTVSYVGPNGGVALIRCNVDSESITSAVFEGYITRQYSAKDGNPVTVDEATGIISHTADQEAGSAGPDSDVTLDYDDEFLVPEITRDAYGHVTGLVSRTLKMPSASEGTGSYIGNSPIDVTDMVISHEKAENGSQSGGPTEAGSLSFGESFLVPYVETDAYGHVLSVTSQELVLPEAPEGTSYVGVEPIVIDGNTISHSTASSAYTGGPTADQSPVAGGTFNVPYISSDGYGHVTLIEDRTITLPQSTIHGSIDGVDFDGASDISHLGVCSTASSTAVKVVECDGYVLEAGIAGPEVDVYFSNTNTAANITLNVNDTGAIAVRYNDAAITSETAGCLLANHAYRFIYDGTYYRLVDGIKLRTDSVDDDKQEFRNIVIVEAGTDPTTVDCPVGTIIMVKES